MPQSLTQLLVHVVFSTKDRAPLIADAWRPDLHAYIGGILRKRKCDLLAAGGIEDHIHLLVRMPTTISIADMIRDVKTNSSAWRHESGDGRFAWQSGYGVFSVSPESVAAVSAYIADQRDHHRKATFQDEYRSFLRTHGMEFDERYLWD